MLNKPRFYALAAMASLFAMQAAAQTTLKVKLLGLTAAGNLPVSSAFCLPKPQKPEDKSPALKWSPGPAGTKSYVVISIDPDVPKNLSLMNKPGVTIAVDEPRMNIYHWVLINIPASVHYLPAGVDGTGFKPGGKPFGPAKIGVQGSNDYWPFFNKRPTAPAVMHGPYGGYDGPCPPANDLKTHDYKFQVFALDVPSLPLTGQFFAPAALTAMQGHVLAQGEVDAKYYAPGKSGL
jgi:Raf kinase inhibitor-like YbhB/YbcL family protein